MPELSINEIADAVQGKILNINTDNSLMTFSNYQFDTRLVEGKNTLFFALKSETNDGHQYVNQLENTPKTAAVVSQQFDTQGLKLPLIQVGDPLKAAHKLAAYVRNKYSDTTYVGITGSAGKTTTKEFAYQILSYKYQPYRSHKNWNNWIGMPFSILNMHGDEDMALFELAMSYPGIGEIDLLAEILRPDVAIILNVFPVHLEFLKNLDNVALAKSEILNYLSSDDTGFITGDSPYILEKTRSKKGRKIFFGKNPQTNNIILKGIIREGETTKINIDFFGINSQFETFIINQIHIENLFIAIILAQHLGMKNEEIQAALKNIQPLSGRGEIKELPDFTIIDETYNSNPAALKRSLEWVDKEYQGRKIAVLGDMLELGEDENFYHQDVGQFLASLNYHYLVTIGKRAEKIAHGAIKEGFAPENVKCCYHSVEAGKYIKKIVESGSVILFKASRGIQLEKAIEEFTGGEKEIVT
jgi:UDP-N-acetylmuramoyl-tripeptide--D-alanyl-D-alanine ligase